MADKTCSSCIWYLNAPTTDSPLSGSCLNYDVDVDTVDDEAATVDCEGHEYMEEESGEEEEDGGTFELPL